MADDADPKSSVIVGLHRFRPGAHDAVLDLYLQQRERRGQRDSRLPVPSETEIRTDLRRLGDAHPLILASVEGTAYACAFPDVEVHQADDDGLAYFQRESGIAHGLAMRDDSSLARAAMAALVRRLVDWWAAAGASGGKLTWPAADIDVTPEFERLGLAPDAYVEHRLADQIAARATLPSDVRPRPANRDDLEAAVALNSMVLDEHVWVSPFARWVPGVEQRFTERFLAGVDGGLARGLFFVAEVDDQVVAMAECEIETHHAGLDAMFPAGTMGYVHVFGVDKTLRRRRVGTSLASFVLGQLSSRGVASVRLTASHYNYPSRTFWRRMGFNDVWRTYQTHQLR